MNHPLLSNLPFDNPMGGICPLRVLAQRLLMINSPQHKATSVLQTRALDYALDVTQQICDQPGLPGRPVLPILVHPSKLKTRAVGTLEGRAGLIHALTHIEANAINLALDMMWRFTGMPEAFYMDWWQVAQEEALHFNLLQAHLSTLGFSYGDFPAHDGLWDMAERTKDDVLARLALVPRTLEARGLDATPAVKNRLVSVGDLAGAAILDIILRDEIGHVAIGNHWYRVLCDQRALDPIAAYADLARRYQAPVLRGPFNLSARRAAGFTQAELDALTAAAVSAGTTPDLVPSE
jgi:uncharacterized ferritin-like protein (DUF455 family)